MFCAIFTLASVIVLSLIVHNSAIEPDEDVFLFEDDNSISIGGLFEDMESQRRLAFEHAVEMINSNPTLALQSRLVAKSKQVPHLDSFIVGKKVCELMSEGVAGIFGPMSPITSHHVQSLCDTMEIPHISTKWDLNQRRSSCLLNLHPHPDVLAKAMRDIVEAWNFKGFTVLYDDFDALRKINGLIKMADDKGYLVTVRQLELNKFGNYRTVLGGVKHSEEKNIVIECSHDILFDVLMQAHQVGLVGNEYNYIITSLDFQTINLEPFQFAGTNITGIRLVKIDDPYVIEVVTNWTLSQDQEENNDDKITYHDYYDTNVRERNEEPIENENESGTPATVEQPKNVSDLPIPITEAALTHDAVLLLSKALRHLDITRAKSVDCKTYTSWAFGFTVINFMRLTEVKGMSGLVKFDHEGFRRDIELEIVELGEDGLKMRGFWNSTTGLSMIYHEQGEEQSLDADDLRNTTFTVLIALTHPYAMLKEAANTLIGNDRYEGFGIDVIHELSLMSGFNYTFKEHYDKSSGNPETLPNGTRMWTGMIGEVVGGRADLAIADITITREREMDADFTMPIMNLGISILHRTPGKAPPSLFSFLSPFSYQVWGCVMSAYFGVSLLLFVMARISPYEWTNPYPCIEEPENLENQFSFINSLWFTIGSLMQQGSDIAPISVSTRMVASIWWFFTLIMVSSYTANLAAFLTVEDVVKPFEDVKELANQDIIKWGAKHGGSTVNFFRDSKDPTYKKIYEFMKRNPDCMMTSNEDGVERVLRERNYAFFMESTSIEYEVERKCNLGQVGGLLDNKGYGIVMRQNSTYWDILSRNVVKLQEKGRLIHLKDKWWKEKRGGGACLDKKGTGEASELNLDNVGGMFVVLVSGCIFAAFLSLMELLFDIYTREDKASFKEELMHEIKFIMKCRGTVKPMRQPTQVIANSNDIDKRSKYSSKTSLYI